MATLRGEAVDRPPVSFYEIGGWKMMPSPDDEFCVWNDPSWRPLVGLAEEETDLIRMVGPAWKGDADNGLDELVKHESWREGPSRLTRTTIAAAGTWLVMVAEYPHSCVQNASENISRIRIKAS